MNRIWLPVLAALALVALPARGAGVPESEVEAVLSVMGYGYSVKVLVNREKASDRLSVSVQIQKTAPAGFKPVLIGEAK